MSPIHTTEGWSSRATCKDERSLGYTCLPLLGALLTPSGQQDLWAPGCLSLAATFPAAGVTVCSRSPGLCSLKLEIGRRCSAAGEWRCGPRDLIAAYAQLPGLFRCAHHEKSCPGRVCTRPLVRLCVAVPLWQRLCLEGGSEALGAGRAWGQRRDLPWAPE